jgi:hypothetical protein
MITVPAGITFAAISRSRTLSNWRMRPHFSAAVSPSLRATTAGSRTGSFGSKMARPLSHYRTSECGHGGGHFRAHVPFL